MPALLQEFLMITVLRQKPRFYSDQPSVVSERLGVVSLGVAYDAQSVHRTIENDLPLELARKV